MNEFAVTAPIVKTVLVTPELAAKWLSNNPNNRSVSRMVVQKYARIMKAGGWYLTPSGILLGRGEMLLDGQHRLEAIIESGESVFMTVFYDVDPEAVDYVDIGRHRSTTHVAERYGFKNSALLVTALHDVGEIMFGGATKRQLQNHYLARVLPEWDARLQPHITMVRSYCNASGTKIKSIYIALHYFYTQVFGPEKTEKVFERLLAAYHLDRGVKESTVRRELILKGYVKGTREELNVGETMFMLNGTMKLFSKEMSVAEAAEILRNSLPEELVATMKEGFDLSSSIYNKSRKPSTRKRRANNNTGNIA